MSGALADCWELSVADLIRFMILSSVPLMDCWWLLNCGPQWNRDHLSSSLSRNRLQQLPHSPWPNSQSTNIPTILISTWQQLSSPHHDHRHCNASPSSSSPFQSRYIAIELFAVVFVHWLTPQQQQQQIQLWMTLLWIVFRNNPHLLVNEWPGQRGSKRSVQTYVTAQGVDRSLEWSSCWACVIAVPMIKLSVECWKDK